MNELIGKVKEWHHARNLIEGSNNVAQFGKLLEEVQELFESIHDSRSPIDDIGDIVVVLIGMAEREGLSLEQCLQHAYDDSKEKADTIFEDYEEIKRIEVIGNKFAQDDKDLLSQENLKFKDF